jgi:hypothetical protein
VFVPKALATQLNHTKASPIEVSYRERIFNVETIGSTSIEYVGTDLWRWYSYFIIRYYLALNNLGTKGE